MRLGAKLNRNEQGSAVVRLRFAAVASVGCMGPAAARRPASRMAIIGTARAQKRRSKQSGTSICCRAWHVNLESGAFVGADVGMLCPSPLSCAQRTQVGHRAMSEKCPKADMQPPHSITSLARPTSGSEKVRPSALAVLRLMISSTLDTCSTGRSAGLSPLRILPTKTPKLRYPSAMFGA
jgi:hypothetical protein